MTLHIWLILNIWFRILTIKCIVSDFYYYYTDRLVCKDKLGWPPHLCTTQEPDYPGLLQTLTTHTDQRTCKYRGNYGKFFLLFCLVSSQVVTHGNVPIGINSRKCSLASTHGIVHCINSRNCPLHQITELSIALNHGIVNRARNGNGHGITDI